MGCGDLPPLKWYRDYNSFIITEEIEDAEQKEHPLRNHCLGEPRHWVSFDLGSIPPAAWSFMLAAKARGLGGSWTTLHLMQEQEVAAELGIPRSVTQAVLLPVAYFNGEDFKPAKRIPAQELTYSDNWGYTR